MPGTETAVSVKKGCRSAGSEKDEVPFEMFLADDRSAFQRGEDRSFRLRKPEAGFNDRVGYESGVDGLQELLETSVLQGRDGNRLAISGEMVEFLGRKEIDLVQNLDDRFGLDGKLG